MKKLAAAVVFSTIPGWEHGDLTWDETSVPEYL
jgi:hypothetical protein